MNNYRNYYIILVTHLSDIFSLAIQLFYLGNMYSTIFS
jgi:hypothetical protein